MNRGNRHIAIVGAGASGLFLAKKLSEDKRFRITVFEKNRQIGAKLRASGGGKANIFNREIRPEHYNEPASVVDVLNDLPKNRVEIVTEHNIQHLEYQNGKWYVNDFPTAFDAIALASGSPAGMIPKNQRNYNSYLQRIPLKTRTLEASLSGFKLAQYPKSLSGCRTKAIVSLYQSNKLIHKEFGEVTFKDEGVSGIVVMNLSAYYRRLPSRENCRLEFNLIYWDERFDAVAYLAKYGNAVGLLHPKLAALHQAKPFPVTALAFPIEDTYPMESAQVCHGGIDLSEVDENFAAKNHPGMYILGEMLDVDGVCGGYNLFFAFASAAVAAEHLLGTSDGR